MQDKVHGSLYGVMLGDARGVPVETLTHDEIIKALGPDGVTDFIDPKQTRNKDTAGLTAGSTSDDWHFTRALLRSIIDAKRWDAKQCIASYVSAFQESSFGCGKSTRTSLKAIIDGERDGLTAPERLPNLGLGNGVMMAVTPLALYHVLRSKKLHGEKNFDWKAFGKDVRELGNITHSDPRAWIAAFASGMMVVGSMQDAYAAEDGMLRWVFRIADLVEQFESFCVANPHERVLTQKLRDVHCYTHDALRLREHFGCKFIATETLPFTVGTFMRHQFNFVGGITEAVNAGGDTDTNASIVGAMIGANVGAENIPLEWRNFRPEYQEAITLGDQLIALFK